MHSIPRYLKCLASQLLVLIIAGCATVQPVTVPEGLPTVAPGRSGIVFGTIGLSGNTPFTQHALVYRAKGGKATGQFVFRRSGIVDTQIDFTEGRTTGSLFFARLPAGEYELVNVRFFENRAQFGTTTFSSKTEFSVPFTIAEGKATYLGEFLSATSMGKNVFGLSVPAGGYFFVADRLQRDRSLLVAKEASAASMEIANSTLDPVALKVPFFQPSK